MRWERWSPPNGLGATWPTRCFCCDQRQALARLTPKRSAACRQLAPADTADATRWRRATDKVVGMASSLPCQLRGTQHSFRSNELRSSRQLFLTGVVNALSFVSRTKTASSFAGSVLLALRLIEWSAPSGSDQLSPAR